MTNLELVKSLRGKKLKDLTPEQLSRVKAFAKNTRLNREQKQGFAQFRRAIINKNNNYRLKLSDLTIKTMQLKKDKDGKFTYNKKGQLKKEEKK